MVSRIKIFGERNTGTNFAESLVALNHPGLTVLSHGSNDGIAEAAARFPEAMRPIALERLIDARRGAEFPESYGWKHAATRADRLRAAPAFEESCFLFLVRNPYYFLNSLWRRPYNLLSLALLNRTDPDQPLDKGAFLRAPILLNQRDNLSGGLIDTPVDLWTAKTRTHVATALALGDRALLIRYEDMVAAPHRIADWLAGLGHEAAVPLRVPGASTKGDDLGFEEYRERARDYDPAEDFGPEDLDFIRSRLDADLCRRLGYGS